MTARVRQVSTGRSRPQAERTGAARPEAKEAAMAGRKVGLVVLVGLEACRC